MDLSEIVPVEEQCSNVSRVNGQLWSCMRRTSHPGVHAAEPGPGETVTWPVFNPEPPHSFTGFLDPYGLARTTPEEMRQYRDARTAEESREARRDAVELAVTALKPLAGGYGAHLEEYGVDIINLAAQLGNYIQNGEE